MYPSNKIIDNFITLVAHETKTPLTHIIGFSDLLQKNNVAIKPKLREKYLKIINNDSKRIDRIVSKMLSLSRFDLGINRFFFRKIYLLDIIRDIRRIIDPKIKNKAIKSRYELIGDISYIITDKEKIEEALLYLLENAIDNTKKGQITLRIEKEKNMMHFSVTDTGIGIEKKHLHRIFNRFYQTRPIPTRRVGGCGLGLSVCKEIVEHMGGKIWVTSKVNKGSTFHFTLPIKKTEAQAKQKI